MEREYVMNIYIRVDGNSQIGLGHVKRCLSIADELKKLDVHTVFIMADKTAKKVVTARGFEVISLDTPFDHMDAELNKMNRIIKENSIHKLLIDSYFVDVNYLEKLNEHFVYQTKIVKGKTIVKSVKIKLAYIDDFVRNDFPVDLIIRYNISETPVSKLMDTQLQNKNGTQLENSLLKDTNYLLGCNYAPVADEFRNATFTVKKQVEQVLITTGGSDSLNIASRIGEVLLKDYPTITFHIVSGPFNRNKKQLQEMEQEYSNMILHCNCNNMSELMNQCDIAISSAGSTMYELCSVGIPTICFYYVDNQENIANGFERIANVPNAGNYQTNPEETINGVKDFFAQLLTNETKRNELHHAMKQLVDGEGAKRIAACLKSL